MRKDIVERNRRMQELYWEYRKEGVSPDDAIDKILALPEFRYAQLNYDTMRKKVLYKSWPSAPDGANSEL